MDYFSEYDHTQIVGNIDFCIAAKDRTEYTGFLFEELKMPSLLWAEAKKGVVKDINEYFKVGETIYVEILDIDEDSAQLKLSIKNIEYKKNIAINRKKIKETSLGFKTLEYKLPIWIEESLKKTKNH